MDWRMSHPFIINHHQKRKQETDRHDNNSSSTNNDDQLQHEQHEPHREPPHAQSHQYHRTDSMMVQRSASSGHDHHHHHKVSRQYNSSELIHQGPLLKLCSANLWSKLTLGGYWETRTFFLHEDKTIFNVNDNNELRGKWTLEHARIVSIPPEWQPWQSKYKERGFMIEFTQHHRRRRHSKDATTDQSNSSHHHHHDHYHHREPSLYSEQNHHNDSEVFIQRNRAMSEAATIPSGGRVLSTTRTLPTVPDFNESDTGNSDDLPKFFSNQEPKNPESHQDQIVKEVDIESITLDTTPHHSSRHSTHHSSHRSEHSHRSHHDNHSHHSYRRSPINHGGNSGSDDDDTSGKSTGGLLVSHHKNGNQKNATKSSDEKSHESAAAIDQIICYAKTKELCEDWKFLIQLIIDHNPHDEENHLKFVYYQHLFRIADLLKFPFKSHMKLLIDHEQPHITAETPATNESITMKALEHVLGGHHHESRRLSTNNESSHHQHQGAKSHESHRHSNLFHSIGHDHDHCHSHRHHRMKTRIDRVLTHSVLQHEPGGPMRYIVEKTLNSLYVTLHQLIEEDPHEFLSLLHQKFYSQAIHLKIVGEYGSNSTDRLAELVNRDSFATDDEDGGGGSSRNSSDKTIFSRSRRRSGKDGRHSPHGDGSWSPNLMSPVTSEIALDTLTTSEHFHCHNHKDGCPSPKNHQGGNHSANTSTSIRQDNVHNHDHHNCHQDATTATPVSNLAHRPYYRTSFTEKGDLLIEVLRIDHHLSNCGYDIPNNLQCSDGLPYLVHKALWLNTAKRDQHLAHLTKLLGGEVIITKGSNGMTTTRVKGKLWTLECDMKSNYEALIKHQISPGKFGYIFYDQVLDGLCENIIKDQMHDSTVGHLIGSYCKNKKVIIRPYSATSSESRSTEGVRTQYPFVGTMKTACTFTSEGNLLIEYLDPSFDPKQVGLDILSRLSVGELPYSIWLTVYKENAHKEEILNHLRDMTCKPLLTFEMDLVSNYHACLEMNIATIRFGSLFVTTMLAQIEKALKVYYLKYLTAGPVGKVINELNQVFRGNHIIFRPMHTTKIQVDNATSGDCGSNNQPLYRVSFSESDGDLVIEYRKSPLVSFESCSSILIEQLNVLFKIDGRSFNDGIAVRIASVQ